MKEEISVDFLKKKYQLAPDRQQERKNKKTFKWLVGFFIFTALVGIGASYGISTKGNATNDLSGISIFSSFRGLITSQDKALSGETSDRINILLMGIGGAGHAGPELTDTLIFASFQPSTGEIGMLSIPRDMVVSIPEYGYRKINAANAYGELNEVGSGPQFSADIVSEVLDQEINYYAKVDFTAFEELIDAIGGVDVYVERSFTDTTYPTDDDLVQTVAFTQGWAHMNGARALQFARSRHGNNGEGTDFARAERQQKIIVAIQKQILSPSILLNPAKLSRLINLFQENVTTNLTVWEIMRLSGYASNIQMDKIRMTVLDNSANSPLYSSTINGSYVLLPKQDDWSEVQAIAKNIFDPSRIATTTQTATTPNTVRIEIQNGTALSGLAFETSQRLTSTGFNVVKVGNAISRDYSKTIIYDLTQGTQSIALAELQQFFEADVQMSASGWIFSNNVVPRELTVTTPGESEITSDEHIDFLIILGANAQNLVLR